MTFVKEDYLQENDNLNAKVVNVFGNFMKMKKTFKLFKRIGSK